MTETPDRRVPGWMIVLGVSAILALAGYVIVVSATGGPG